MRARVKHRGRGKFEVLETEGGADTGKVVDAADIVFCIDPSVAKARISVMIRQTREILESWLNGSIDKAQAKNKLAALLDRAQ